MAWSSPLTAVVGAVLTAAQWNATVRGDLLETAPAKATTAGGYFVATGTNAIVQRTVGSANDGAVQTTGSTSYVTLNAGPVVTSTTGTSALVIWSVRQFNNTAGQNTYSSVAVSGASSSAASDSLSVLFTQPTANYANTGTYHWYFTGLNAGSNVFTMQHRVTGGTGSFDERTLTVVPF